MDDNLEDPLVKALPPASDYMTYLTIIEYNLSKERLLLLHKLLQDTSLTTNIGWDLVHLLLPLLPESHECLMTVAHLGNPREVILKVTEMLEELSRDGDEDQDDEEDDDKDGDDDGGSSGSAGCKPGSDNEPSKASRQKMVFLTLVQMLEILHPRIKTKYPSRFLATSLTTMLPAYGRFGSDRSVTMSINSFIRAMIPTTRPPLPPRDSSANTLQQPKPSLEPVPEPDPEDEHDTLTAEESREQKRLLQVFFLRVIEIFGCTRSEDFEGTGFAWCARFQEVMHPGRTVPGKLTYSERLADNNRLRDREETLLGLHQIAVELGVGWENLIEDIQESTLSNTKDSDQASAVSPLHEELTFPPTGRLLLLCCSLSISQFHSQKPPHTTLALFPDFDTLITYFIGNRDLGSIGSEPPAIVDAILYLGLTIFASCFPKPQEPAASPSTGKSTAEDEKHPACPFLTYPSSYQTLHNLLTRLSVLSSQCPFPSLRYHAHTLTSQILHAHPDEHVRLEYIRNTLEHCPDGNITGSAIGWLKEEILRADRRLFLTDEAPQNEPHTPTNNNNTPSAKQSDSTSQHPSSTSS